MLNGILVIHKEKGFTSHDVVAKLRGICKQKKIGHTGTLDPDATGVLPVCLGRATKVCDMLTDSNKEYEAVIRLGCITDTQDSSGEILEEHDTTHLTNEMVKDAILSFVGLYNQIPPMYSALKVNGQKLCDLARKGIEVERKAREVNIFSIEILEMNLPFASMRVSCSKGTYIRTLCHDIGQKLGVGACMEQLCRTKAAGFDLSESISLAKAEEMAKSGQLESLIIPVDRVFEDYKSYHVKKEFERLYQNGNQLLEEMLVEETVSKDMPIRIYTEDDVFVGVYTYQTEKKHFSPVKMFLN